MNISDRTRRRDAVRGDPLPNGQAVDCRQCGHPHERCRSHRKGDGMPCKKPRMLGQWVCAHHGGSTEAARRAGELRVAEAEVGTRLAKRLRFNPDAKPITDPLAAMAALAGALDELVRDLGERLDGHAECSSCGHEVHVSDSDRALFTAMLGQLRPLLGDMAKLNLEGRRQAAAEVFAAELAALLGAVVRDLALTPEQAERWPVVVRRHLGAAAGELTTRGT